VTRIKNVKTFFYIYAVNSVISRDAYLCTSRKDFNETLPYEWALL